MCVCAVDRVGLLILDMWSHASIPSPLPFTAQPGMNTVSLRTSRCKDLRSGTPNSFNSAAKVYTCNKLALISKRFVQILHKVVALVLWSKRQNDPPNTGSRLQILLKAVALVLWSKRQNDPPNTCSRLQILHKSVALVLWSKRQNDPPNTCSRLPILCCQDADPCELTLKFQLFPSFHHQ